ncbi:MAG TPA: sulfatase, partial [bacterium]
NFKGDVPHVLLLILDTVRSDHLSCYGYPFATSPNLDQLAQEGLLCRNAYSASNWTPPGHISIFTGKYPAQHGNDGKVYMPDDLVSMTEILNGQGYYCIAMYNNPTAGRGMNLTQGFDLDLGVFSYSWLLPAPFRVWYKLVRRDSGSRATFLAAERIFNWIEKHGGHLFMYVNITEAHAPYRIHEPYFSQFASHRKIMDPARVRYLRTTLDLVLEDSSCFAGLSNDDFAYLRAAYDSEIAYADDNLGRFSRAMRNSGVLDRTLLIVTADHGEFLGEHWTLGHPELLFNPVLQVPLILRYPKQIAPRIMTEIVSTVDIFPTVLNLLDLQVQIPPEVQGLNLLSGELPVDRALLSANISPEGGCYSLIKDGRKLIVNQDNFLCQYFPVDSLLFDLSSDPGEQSNLLDMPSASDDGLGLFLSSWLDEITVRPKKAIQISRDELANLKALGYSH